MTHDALRLPLAGSTGWRAENRPEFGEAFTPNMVTATWTTDGGWSTPELSPRRPLVVDPALMGLHYGQSVFEGLKAHRRDDGGVAVFRPDAHARRMSASAARLAMPAVPEELFLSALDLLVGRDQEELPDDPALSLYLRPLLFATEPRLALRPSRSYLFLLQAFVTGAFFGDRPRAVSVRVSHDHGRAARGGTGAAKAAGNYAPTFLAQLDAAREGCDQVVWLDTVEQRWIEEMGAMNIFFVRGSGRDAVVSTPPLTGSLLPGITRDSLLALAERAGLTTTEAPVTVDEWRDGCRSGEITETFACGTAAIVTPVREVRAGADTWTVGTGEAPVAGLLRTALQDLQRGAAPDPFGWLRPVPPSPRG